MKKIKILTFLGILLCTFFIFNLNYKASASSEKIIFQKIDLIYNDNFIVTDYDVTTYFLKLKIEITSDLFIDNEYLQDYEDIEDNVLFHLVNFEERNNNSNIFNVKSPELFGNRLSGIVEIRRNLFQYFYEDILGVSEQSFHEDLYLYLDELSEYFKLYVRIDTTRKYDGEYNFADIYGINMQYKPLNLFEDFRFTGNIWATAGFETYIFEYEPSNESLKELIRLWDELTPNFMKIYISGGTNHQYLENYNLIPSDDLGWTIEDGYIYIIIKGDSIPSGYTATDYEAMLAEVTIVETWVVTETTDEYQLGYNTGYQHGYNNGYLTGHNRGYNEGFSDGEIVGYNNGFDNGYSQGRDDGYYEGFDIGYDIGYEDGLQVSQGEAYDRGYTDGANESFIASIDKWLVPAIIIVMLLGGFFAIVRKKREGEI